MHTATLLQWPTAKEEGTLVSLFLDRAAAHPERVALRVLDGGEARLSWAEWANASRRFAAALVAVGVRPGDRVAILAGNGPVWPVADLGVLLAGGISVGVYPTSAPGQVRQVLADAGAVAVVVDDAQQRDKVLAERGALPALRTIVCPVGGAGTWEWDHFLAAGDAAALAEVDRRTAALRPDDTALLIYTSGSTGEPKGARISHRCLTASVRSIRDTLGLVEQDTMLSFLPYSHAAERIFGQFTRILCGMEAGLLRDHSRLWEAARSYGPTIFGGLPRFYERVYEALRAEEAGARGVERARWRRVLELGRERSRLRRAGQPVPPLVDAEWRAAGAPICQRMRSYFGGRVRLATSGGASFPREVAEYLDALGLPLLGAYGLTEHLCVAFNRPGRYTFDSAGPPMPGTELRIADDGEILVRRGPLTFDGYHGRPAETVDAFTADGQWLRTGDLGEVDPRGFLRVTGRKKELIALSTGKKVAPIPIEARLAEEELIGQAVLYGEGRKFVSALLCPRRPMAEAWARERGLSLEYSALLRHPAFVAAVQAAVDRVNALLSRPEQLRRFVLLDRDLSQELDELTPTLKLRRAVVVERFRPELDALYLTPDA